MSARILLLDAVSRWVSIPGDEHHEQVVLPLGLMYLSAYLKQHVDPSLEIEIVNTLIDLPRRGGIGAVLRELRPQVVGVRGLTLFEPQFNELLEEVKAFDRTILTVAGGPLPTTEPDRVARNPNVDVCVIGEGEITFAEIVRAFLDGRSPAGIAGTASRDASGAIVRGGERLLITDLDALPFPDYERLDLAAYQTSLNYGYNRRRQGVLLSSRGCPYRCVFCHVNLGKAFRARSPANLLAEVELLHRRHGVDDIFVVDDIFNLDYERAVEFLDLLIDARFRVRLYLVNGIRADLVDTAFIDKMKAAGVIWISYAVESGDPGMQKLIRKHLKFEKARAAIAATADRGLIVNYSFILGFPTETLSQANKTLEFIGTLPPSVLPFCFGAKYYPGTEMYDMAIAMGYDEARLRLAMTEPYHAVAHENPSAMSESELAQLHQYYLRKLFIPGIPRSIRTLRAHYADDEVVDLYRALFHRPFASVQEVLDLCAVRPSLTAVAS